MRVYSTTDFLKESEKVLSNTQKDHLKTLMNSLHANRGKRIGARQLRQYKIQEKRVYAVIDNASALFIAVATKKTQQLVISQLLENIDLYVSILKKMTDE